VHPTPELIDLVARQKALNYTPGDEYLYSNTNYFLLAEVIHRVSKKPFAQFAAENIFQPLGMTHTRFHDDHRAIVPGRVAAYGPGPNGTFVVNWSTNFDKVGDGGLMSSVDDLLLWDRNFYDNKLGKGTLLTELQTRGVLNNGQSIAYALGLEIGQYRGLPMVDHGGSLFGYRTQILRFPTQHFTVLCLCNVASANTANLSRRVADVYLEKDLGPATASARPPAETAPQGSADVPLGDYAGVYDSPELDTTYRLSVEDGSLMLRVTWSVQRKLAARRVDEFAGGGITLLFHRDAQNRITGLSVSAGRIRNVRFDKRL
jgi:CubicO group peptidase (beta-lactamase class C family)